MARTRSRTYCGRVASSRETDAAFPACEIRSGATLSFHHHLRNGDQVLNSVLAVAAARGLTDLTVAASSLFPVHAPLVEHMRRGVVLKPAPSTRPAVEGDEPVVGIVEHRDGRVIDLIRRAPG